ncbi:MAG: site-specific integrase [Glaciecola sp.]
MSEIQKIFTDKFIASIKPKKSLSTYADKQNRHLKLFVRPNGNRSYYFRAKMIGRDIKRKLGDVEQVTLNEARIMADAIRQSFGVKPKHISNSVEQSVVAGLSIDNLFSLYKHNELDSRNTIAGRTHSLVVAYNNHVSPLYGDLLVSSLNRKSARALMREYEAKGYATFNKVLTIFKASFNYAIEYEESLGIAVNPFQCIKKMPGVSRNRYLTHSEARDLLSALAVVNNQDVADIYRLALFTGARLSNVKQMKWSDISMNRRAWLIPASQTKTRQVYELPLISAALSVLQSRSTNNLGEYVFSSKTSKYGYITGGADVWKAALKSSGLYHDNPGIRPRPHDLRRTFATWQLQAGADISVVSKSLCHSSLKHTLVYAHSSADQLRGAINSAFDGLGQYS